MRVPWIPAVALALITISCAGYVPRSTGTETTPTDDAVTVNDRLYVARPSGLAVVSVATGALERELPEGLLSPDRASLYVVDRAGADTVVRTLDPSSGRENGRMRVSGAFAIPRSGYGPVPDALSANGRFLVLDGATPGSFAVIDLRSSQERTRFDLKGPFTFDAIDDYGSSLYLLEHPQPGTDRYNVRLYDLGLGLLSSQLIVDQKSAQPTAGDIARGTMGGIYHSAATAGLWHFGLYTSSSSGPVVHALNMTSRFAFCVRTLSGASTFREAWSIVPSPKGDRVFALNAANGAFASIKADSLDVAQRTFSVRAASSAAHGSAVVSHDGSRLYATGGRGILAVDLHTLSLKGQYLAERDFASVMVSADGTRLYVLGTDGTVNRVEPSTGRDLGVVARLPNAVAIVRID